MGMPKQIREQIRDFDDLDWEEVLSIAQAMIMSYDIEERLAQAHAIVMLAEERATKPRVLH